MNDPFTPEPTDEPLASDNFMLPEPSARNPAPADELGRPEAVQARADEPRQPEYVSPVLSNLSEDLLPHPWPACGTCPAAMWFQTTDELKCYCSRMHAMTWVPGGVPPPILACDGRELALLQMAEEQAEETPD